MFAISTAGGRIAVLAVALAGLVGFLLWSKRATSNSFFLGVLAGTGLVLSFDIAWVHWIFGLHHVTNSREDAVIEPLFVLTGLIFMWYGITRERRHSR
jgi:drug/metabolite transporter (DMT)-like permease